MLITSWLRDFYNSPLIPTTCKFRKIKNCETLKEQLSLFSNGLFHILLYRGWLIFKKYSNFNWYLFFEVLLWFFIENWALIVMKCICYHSFVSQDNYFVSKTFPSKLRVSCLFCPCLAKVMLTDEPIWFSFTVKPFIGPWKVFNYFGEGYHYPPKRNCP